HPGLGAALQEGVAGGAGARLPAGAGRPALRPDAGGPLHRNPAGGAEGPGRLFGPAGERLPLKTPPGLRAGGVLAADAPRAQPNSLFAVLAISSPWWRAPASSMALGWRW